MSVETVYHYHIDICSFNIGLVIWSTFILFLECLFIVDFFNCKGTIDTCVFGTVCSPSHKKIILLNFDSLMIACLFSFLYLK